MDIGVFDRFESMLGGNAGADSNPFIIKADIVPGQIDMKNSLEQFLALPLENEINLKYQPLKFKIKKWK